MNALQAITPEEALQVTTDAQMEDAEAQSLYALQDLYGLQPTQARILLDLVDHPGQVRRAALLVELYGQSPLSAPTLVSQHIHHIRSRAAAKGRPLAIRAVRGVGLAYLMKREEAAHVVALMETYRA